ncbi:EscF/YscF/HrpA family type III secretion system needle major subunit [Phaeobacter sp. HF9A]|uniref:EscF/YscF/HrpA family type III secretion system needle major subunit n=1 Tax=Phaeobacter sp. HF9A TaxID=2721561 RepID=UPI0014313F99|nr:EscF/YscF/HrpA family type III secretion system needle major subunit [Phaeobacter sp. HF9A]NIZ12000.1 type III secretion system needle protein [Phaeobacter sp. HF9A]
MTVGTTTDSWGIDSANWGTGSSSTGYNYVERDGFDLIWRQEYLQAQTQAIESDIAEIEQNANLSDTEKMYAMQMAMNTWSAVTNLRTNMLKTIADTLKTIVRNVA